MHRSPLCTIMHAGCTRSNVPRRVAVVVAYCKITIIVIFIIIYRYHRHRRRIYAHIICKCASDELIWRHAIRCRLHIRTLFIWVNFHRRKTTHVYVHMYTGISDEKYSYNIHMYVF